MPSDFLLEIGTEELPPKALKNLIATFEEAFTNGLDKAQLAHGTVRAFATPRRLALLVNDLAEAQPEQLIEKRGPSVQAAFDNDGNPTKAVLGFARSCGIEDPSQLERMETDKGEWLVFRETRAGATVDTLIEPIATSALGALPIERPMRWGASRVEFVRPVHWVVCLYGTRVIPIQLFGLGAGSESRGHRFMSDGNIKIGSPATYVDAMRAGSVIADFAERRGLIEQQLKEIARTEKAEVVIDPVLLDEVTALVEWPSALVGRFDDEFLAVPEEALISAMKSHQRYFHMVDQGGKLLPRFVTVANIASKDPASVIAGNERVIRPRLSDASFFYEQDGKTTLESKAERLKSIVFQSKLGSYHDKAERVSALAGTIAEMIGANASAAARAGFLAKTDLVTDMVGEFPELQGTMGRYYALRDGEPEIVAEAIAEHYLPTQSGGRLPASAVGQAVAIADKLDTMTGLFGIGQPPTGSRDPFALRRQSLGVIRICIECDLGVNLPELVRTAAAQHGKDFETAELIDYLFERMAVAFQDQGISNDTFLAVRGRDDATTVPAQLDREVRTLHNFRAHSQAGSLAAANKRVANILKQLDLETLASPDTNLFQEPAEGELFSAVTKLESEMGSIDEYESKLLALAELQPVIDSYFDDVLVMADDEALKQNRIATLGAMRKLFLRVADISVLQMAS